MRFAGILVGVGVGILAYRDLRQVFRKNWEHLPMALIYSGLSVAAFTL